MENKDTNTNTNTNTQKTADLLPQTATPAAVPVPVDPGQGGSMSEVIFDDRKFERMHELAKLMASGKFSIPKHLQSNSGDCFAVIMQSMQWGMNPFAVAQKTHVVNGALGYEAQLVNAVVSASRAISGRFHYEYAGDWDAYRASGFNKSKEAGCGVNVGAVIRGESEIRWLPAPLYMETVKTRNSPLWATNPMQQLAYLAVKFWARLYTPDAILGVYSVDELEALPVEMPQADHAEKKKSKTEKLAEKLGATASAEAKTETANEKLVDGEEIVRRITAELEFSGAPISVEDCEKWLREKRLLKAGQTIRADAGSMKRDWADWIAENPRDFVNKVAEDILKA